MTDRSVLKDCWLTCGADLTDWDKMPLECIRGVLEKLAADLRLWKERATKWIDDRWRYPDSPWSFYSFASAIGYGQSDMDELEGSTDVKTAKAICVLLNLLHARERALCQRQNRGALIGVPRCGAKSDPAPGCTPANTNDSDHEQRTN